MKLRRTTPSDLERIDRIYKNGHDDKFALPNLDNAITHAVIEKDGKVIGFGVVKLYAECIAILDLDESKIVRLLALDKLLSEAFRGCEENGLDQMHAYVQDLGMARLLIQKYGFKKATGVALVKEF